MWSDFAQEFAQIAAAEAQRIAGAATVTPPPIDEVRAELVKVYGEKQGPVLLADLLPTLRQDRLDTERWCDQEDVRLLALAALLRALPTTSPTR